MTTYTPTNKYYRTIPAALDPKFNAVVKEVLEQGLAQRGTFLDKFVTVRDLLDTNLISYLNDQETSVTNPSSVSPPGSAILSPPRNLVLISANDSSRINAFNHHLIWDNPTSDDRVIGIQIWRATSTDRSSAEKIAIISYTDGTMPEVGDAVILNDNPTADHWYWIRSFDWYGNYSPWEPNAAQGGYAVTGFSSISETIETLMNALRGEEPDAYSAGTDYEAGNMVSYEGGDSKTRVYECILANGPSSSVQAPASGNPPTTNSTYWIRSGILLTGDVDGEAIVGVDGNMVVDGTIITRALDAEAVTAEKIAAGTITSNEIATTTITVGNLASDTTDRMFENTGRSFNELGDIPIVPSDENLSVYWNFDEGIGSVISDSSGNGYDGTYYGSPTWVQGASGKAISFDGALDYGQLLTPADAETALGLEQDGAISISVWFNSQIATTGTLARIISRDASDYWAIILDQSAASGSQQIKAHISGIDLYSSADISTGAWHHVVEVLDYENGWAYLYVDGELVDSTADLVVSAGSARGVSIGVNEESGPNPYSNMFGGYIDEIRIYDEVLSATQIKGLYLNASGNQSTSFNWNSINNRPDALYQIFYQANAPSGEGEEEGDYWIDSDNNQIYRYDGLAWNLVQDNDIAQAILDAAGAQATADSKIVSFYQNTQPTSDSVGDLWIDTDDDNKMYRWSGSQWVLVRDGGIAQAITDAATAQDAANAAQATADGKVTTYYQNDAPTADGIGDLWVDTNDGNTLYRWSGSDWIEITDANISQALADAATAQSTADGKIVSFYQNTQPVADGIGDIWFDTDDNNKVYRWSGSAWVSAQDGKIADAITAAATAQATADGKVTSFYQDSAPTAEGLGDLWIDTNDGNTAYRWSGSAWIEITDSNIAQALADAATAQATADGKIISFYQTGAPTAAAVGDIWFDTDDNNKVYRWSGSVWVSAQDAGIAQAINDAATAQATADGKVTTFYQTDTPTAEGVGDLWCDIDDGNKLYRWSGSAWTVVQDTAIQQAIADAAGAQSTADGKIVSFYQDTAPTAEGVGDIWADTDDNNELYRWDGNSWVTVRDGTIALAQAAADAADIAASVASEEAIVAQGLANTAQTTADDAQIDASLALSTLDDIAADDKLTPVEKTTLKPIWDKIVVEASTLIPAQATQFAVDDSDFDTAYAALYAYVVTTLDVFGNILTTTTINRTTWDTNWEAYYTERTTLLNAIADKARVLANTAQAQADTALVIADGNIQGYYQNTAPVAGMSFGDIWIDTDGADPLDTSCIYRYEDVSGGSQGTLDWRNNTTNAIGLAYLDIAQNQSDTIAAQATADGKIYVWAQSTPPTSISIGDLWIDTDDNNKTYRAAIVGADEATAGEWEEVPYDVADWDLIFGAAKPSDYASADILLIEDSASKLTITGNTIERTSGDDVWDNVAYSPIGYKNGSFISFTCGQTNSTLMVGLSTDPTTYVDSYDAAHYCWYPRSDATADIYQDGNGNLGQYCPSYDENTVFSVVYDGVKIRYYYDDTLAYSEDIDPDKQLYPFITIHGAGEIVNQIKYGPMTASTPVLPGDATLEAYYAFDEADSGTAFDGSGNDRDGTFKDDAGTSNPTFVGGIASGRCVDFQDDVYVDIPITSFNQNNGSISMWVNLDDTTGNIRLFSTTHSSGSNYEHRTSCSGASSAFNWFMGNGSDSYQATIASDIDDILGETKHIVLTWEYNGSTNTTIKTYLDGEYVSSQTFAGQPSVPDTAMYLGYWKTGDEMNGRMDEVRIYSSTLTANEIRALYLTPSGNQSAKISHSAISGVPKLPSDEYLIGYWALDDGEGLVAADNSGNGHDATLYGDDVSDTDWVAGISGGALYFNSASASTGGTVIDCGNDGDFATLLDGSFSISCWVKCDDYTLASTYQRIFSKHVDSNNKFMLYNSPNNTYLIANLSDGGASIIGEEVFTDITVFDGNLNHLVLTFDNSNGLLKVYMNGIKSAKEVSFTPGSYSKSANVCWGAINSDGTYGFEGLLDECRLYNTVLTYNEAKALFLNPSGNQGAAMNAMAIKNNLSLPSDEDMVLYYNFDAGKGTKVTDNSGYNNHGTFSSNMVKLQDTVWSDGISGNCLDFSVFTIRSAARVDLTTPITLAGSNPWSISYWAEQRGINKMTIGEFNTNENRMYHVDGQIKFRDDNDEQQSYEHSATVGDGVLHHFVLVHKGSGVVDLYLDGEFQSTNTHTDPDFVIDVVGLPYLDDLYNWDGKFDELRIWDGRALTPQEIRALYLNPSGNQGAIVSALSIENNLNLPNDDDLQAYYSMDDGAGQTVTDNSGNQRSGTISGTYPPTWATGKSGKCLYLNGTDQYFESGVTTTPAAWTNDFSLSGWFYIPTSYTWDTSYISCLFSKGSYAGYVGLVMTTTDNVLGFSLRGSTYAASISDANKTITRDEWHHAVGTWDGTNFKMTLYIDGNYIDSFTFAGNPGGSPDTDAFGCGKAIAYTSGTGSRLEGYVDELRIYNTELTFEEVKALYNNPSGNQSAVINYTSAENIPKFPDETYLAGYWNLDQGTGSHIIDNSGNGNNGTAMNGVTEWSSPNYVNAVSGLGITFDSTSDEYILLDDDIVDVSAGCSISMWINPTASASNSVVRWFSTVETGGDDLTLILHNQTEAGPYAVECLATTGVEKKTDSIISAGTWYHIVATYDGSDIHIYVNGVDQTLSGTSRTNSTYSGIGIGNSQSSNCAHGKADEVRLYSTVLTHNEVLALYYNPSGPQGAQAGILGDPSTFHAVLENDGLSIYSGSTQLAKFGATVTVGQIGSGKGNLYVDTNGDIGGRIGSGTGDSSFTWKINSNGSGWVGGDSGSNFYWGTDGIPHFNIAESVGFGAGDITLASSLTQAGPTGGGTPTKEKEAQITVPGTYRIKYQAGGYDSYNMGYDGYVRTYVNGVAHGTLRSIPGGNPSVAWGSYYTEDITLDADDLIQIYCWGDVSGEGAVRNFEVQSSFSLVPIITLD